MQSLLDYEDVRCSSPEGKSATPRKEGRRKEWRRERDYGRIDPKMISSSVARKTHFSLTFFLRGGVEFNGKYRKGVRRFWFDSLSNDCIPILSVSVRWEKWHALEKNGRFTEDEEEIGEEELRNLVSFRKHPNGRHNRAAQCVCICNYKCVQLMFEAFALNVNTSFINK